MQGMPRTGFIAVLSVIGLGLAATLSGWAILNSGTAQAAPSAEPVVAAADSTAVQPFRAITIEDSALAGIGPALATQSAAAVANVAVAATPPPPPPPTTFCPAPGSRFTNSWGAPRSGGRRHKGVDMMAPHGSPVLAPVAGTVRHSRSSLGGLGFYLTDAAGNEYFGTHMQSLGPEGFVEAGTQLGTVGSTGNASSSGPHLHFEVVLAGQGNVNPYPFTDTWCADR